MGGIFVLKSGRKGSCAKLNHQQSCRKKNRAVATSMFFFKARYHAQEVQDRGNETHCASADIPPCFRLSQAGEMTNIRGCDNYLMPLILYQCSLGRKDYISIQSL